MNSVQYFYSGIRPYPGSTLFSRRRIALRRLLFTLTLLTLAAFLSGKAAPTAAQETENVAAPSSSEPAKPPSTPLRTVLQYRRWLAPVDRILQWPFGGRRYVQVKRDRFEQWISYFEGATEENAAQTDGRLIRVVLQARLEGRQLVSGRGFFDFRHPPGVEDEPEFFLPLEPWSTWLDAPTLDDGTPLTLVRSASGERGLLFTSPLSSAANEAGESDFSRVRFRWSLRPQDGSSRELPFQFSLPRSTAVELLLDLPENRQPVIDKGLVVKMPQDEDADTDAEKTVRWRILFGRQSQGILTVKTLDGPDALRRKTAYRQRLVYSMAPQGVEITAQFFLDRSEIPPEEIILDCEAPIRLTDIRAGKQSVPWTIQHGTEGDEGLCVRIDLSRLPKDEDRDLTLVAQSPFCEGRPWQLPRIRARSPGLFWTETRCGIVVSQPLLVRDLSCEEAVQVSPLSSADPATREFYSFKFFEEDARVFLTLGYHVPKVLAGSGVQVRWGANEVAGTMTLDCGIMDGELYALEFPVSPNWKIDLVESEPGKEISSWDIQETSAGEQILSLQLAEPLRQGRKLRLKIVGRFYPENTDDFRLSDLSPLTLLRERNENHYIAVQALNIPFHLQYRSPISTPIELRDPTEEKILQRFDGFPLGTVFPLNVQTQEIRFGMERLKPEYNAEITGLVVLRGNELFQSFQILCQPADSSVDRVYVHFTPKTESANSEPDSGLDSKTSTELESPFETPVDWTWSRQPESLSPLTVRRLTSKEAAELFDAGGIVRPESETRRGETWEIRLPAALTTAFELRAVSSTPLREFTSIPLAVLPAALSQKGEIHFRSPRCFSYHIENARLKSLPVPAESWQRYPEERAVFRYDPLEELRHADAPALALRRMKTEEEPPAAWIWTLQLDTQYESEGTVRTSALFLLENYGRDALRIRLPGGIGTDRVHAVWLNDARVSWTLDETAGKTGFFEIREDNHPFTGGRRTTPDTTPSDVISIPLPEGRRFVSVCLEYSYKDIPLSRRRTMKPRYPSTDAPILTEQWTSWFPPEYDVSSRHHPAKENPARHPRGTRHLKTTNELREHRSFDPFVPGHWERLFQGHRRYREADAAALVFLDWLAQSRNRDTTPRSGVETATPTENGSSRMTVAPAGRQVTWARYLADEKRLVEMLAQAMPEYADGFRRWKSGSSDTVDIVVDRHAFDQLGIFPGGAVPPPETGLSWRRGAELLEQNGLVLLVASQPTPEGDRRFSFYLTSSLMLSVHRQFHSRPMGVGVRFLPDVEALRGHAPESESGKDDPQWMPVAQWIRDSRSVTLPWAVSSQVVRLISATPDWNAFEMPINFNDSLYIVHRNTFASLHWLAFLTVIALTSHRRLAFPWLLLGLMVLFEVIARLVPPCYAGVPSGAFLGAFVSLAFFLIRLRPDRESEARYRRASSVRRVPSSSGTAPGSREDSVTNTWTPGAPWQQERGGDEIPTEILSPPSSALETPLPEEPPTEAPPAKEGPLPGRAGPPGFLPFLLILSIVWLAAAPARAEVPAPRSAATTESTPPVPVPPSRLQPKPPELSSAATSDMPLNELSDENEAFRVFIPVDENRQPVGSVVWIHEHFHRLLARYYKQADTKPLHRWSLEGAEYRGSLSYDPLGKKLELTGLKAEFDVYLSAENAAVTLPMMPVPENGALWDGRAIQPMWRPAGHSGPTRDQPGSLVFQLENETPGRHTLELSLDLKPERVDEILQVFQPVPRIPGALLRLDVPAGASGVQVLKSYGAVTPSTLLSPTLSAEIGPVDSLEFSWREEARLGETDAEQYFWLHARPTQVDIRSLFSYRIEGGTVRHLDLLTDPRWQLSGQFRCDEHMIERVESRYDESGAEPDGAGRGEIKRVFFRTPVSGSVTLRADFVLNEFNGIGKIRLPRILPLQARLLKSMLAVSCHPLLELDYPEGGLGTGFESGWKRHPSLFPPIGVSRDPDEPALPGDGPDGQAAQEPTILAQYDLVKVEPTWTLSIRMPRRRPAVRLTHSFRFDYGDSSALFVGEFTAEGDVFQQRFSLPESFQIEQVRALDARGNTVDLRWNDALGAPGKKILFFRKAVSGQYSVSIQGHFSTELPQDGRRGNSRPTPLPLLTFDDVVVEEETLGVFRSSAILAEIDATGTDWLQSEISPRPPESFAESFTLGSWRRKRDPGGDTPAPETGTPAAPAPGFRIFPNQPILRGKQLTVLAPPEDGGNWSATFDLLWDISGGELETIRFHWDEQCGMPQWIEPPIPWVMQQRNGRSELVLTPRTPFSGKQRFRVRAPLNMPESAMALPRLTPIRNKAREIETESFVLLPRESAGTPVHWELESFEPVDGETARLLEREILMPVRPDPEEAVPADRQVSLAGEDSPLSESSWEMDPTRRILLRATEEKASAILSQARSQPVVPLLDVNLFVRTDGTLFGLASADLRTRGRENLVLVMPSGYDLIQVNCSGLVTKGTRLDERRWRIDLWPGDYPQRLSIVFRGSLNSTVPGWSGSSETLPYSVAAMERENRLTGIRIPELEGVSVQESLWTLSFEASGASAYPAFQVSTLSEKVRDATRETGAILRGGMIDTLGVHAPAAEADALLTLVKINLYRLDHLLVILNSVAPPSPARTAEVGRWYEHWSNEWAGLESLVDDQIAHSPAARDAERHRLLLSAREDEANSPARTIRSFMESRVPVTRGALSVRKKRDIERLQLADAEVGLEQTHLPMTNPLVHWRKRMTDDSFLLCGATEGCLREIRLESVPGSLRKANRFSVSITVWPVLLLGLFLVWRKIRPADLLCQYPHFWGIAFGFLLWNLFPPGYLGIAIIILTLLSLLSPPWPRRREAASTGND